LGVRVAVNGTDREAAPSFDEPARQGRLYITPSLPRYLDYAAPLGSAGN